MQKNEDESLPITKKPLYKRFVKTIYLAVHTLLVSLLLIGSGMLYIAFRPDGLELVNSYLLKPFGIHYRYAKGSLLEGFTLYDVHSDTLRAKKLSLVYRLDTILEGKHIIDKVQIDGLQIHLRDFMEASDTPWPLPTFALREVSLTNVQLISDYPLELDIHGDRGSYDGENLSFAHLKASIKSRYASGAINGKMKNNTFSGNALLYPNAQELQETSGRFTTLPRSLRLHIQELSDTQVRLNTRIDALSLKQDPQLYASAIDLSMDYRYDDPFLDFKASYLLHREENTAKVTQTLRYRLAGETTTQFQGTVLQSLYPLPAREFRGEVRDNAQGLLGKLVFDGTVLDLSSSDYDRYVWKAKTRHADLSFLGALPELIRNSTLEIEADGSYLLGSNSLQGDLHLSHTEGNFSGRFSSCAGVHQLDGNLTLSPLGILRQKSAIKFPDQMGLSLSFESNTTTLSLTGGALALLASLHDNHLTGYGNYYGTSFSLKGMRFENSSVMDIETHTPSLFKTLSIFTPIHLAKGEWYDAQIDTLTHLTYDTALHAKGTISIPWYAAALDSQRAYGGVDGKLSYLYDDGRLLIDHYYLSVADHPITSARDSHLHLSPEGDIIIDEFWVYDSLRLNGFFSPSDYSTSLRLFSERFTYNGPEGKAHAAADITFARDASANQHLSGSIDIQDALITFLPLQQFKVMDNDIIIIQDVRPPSDTKLSMNLHITAAKPVHLKTAELDLKLDPDITLWKDPSDPMQILGMISIPSGTAKTAGKSFDINPSYLYFGGAVPLNPYLDFTITHEVDYKKLHVYVTHTLDSPIFLFASDPVMSQNDIMSYLLFGSPANTALNSDRSSTTARADATNFMLGAGLKQLIGGATKIQLDTMNILTTAEGGMGFEVGTHLNKDLRVLYKNDTVSSILVQYQLNRWLRLDADIHELGQGINAVYVKDFRDFLPHHSSLKRKP